MTAADEGPVPVRLLVTADCGGGFQLTVAPPLPDVQPGESYSTECWPESAVVFRHVVVHGFKLSRLAVGGRTITVRLTTADECWHYHVEPPVVVGVGESVVLHLYNDGAEPLRPKTARFITEPERIQIAPSNGPDWTIKHISVGNRCGFCGKEFDLRIGHTCSEAAISPGGKTFLTAAPLPEPSPDPNLHHPRIARTLADGPGNQTLVRGCACGASVMSPEAYAAHVGWPVEAVRAVLNLYGIADDLVLYKSQERHSDKLPSRGKIARKISEWLEVRGPTPSTAEVYAIVGSEIVGPNLRMSVDHVIELLRMRHVDDPRSLPTVSMMAAITELVALLNGAHAQGRRGTP